MSVFEITIRRKEKEPWPVVVMHQPPTGELAIWTEGFLSLDPRTLDSLLPQQKEYGLLLGKALFAEELRDAFVRAVAEAKAVNDPLRVLLNIEADELRCLHWEKLHAPFDRGWDYLLLNQGTPFSIYLPSQIQIARRFSPITRHDLRALLLVAGPKELDKDYGLASFDVAATVGSIRHALGEIPCDVLAQVEGRIGPPSLKALCEHLTAGSYTLLHIVCHGRTMKGSDETILYFPADESGEPVLARDAIEWLGRLDRLPHLTLLSTCESADPRAEAGLGGLGQRLVRDLGMPAVLAMTDRISIATAEALASAFYARLREHGEVDGALCEALAGLQGRDDVTVPALFSRLGGLALFSDTLDRLGEAYTPRLLQAIAKHRAKLRQQLEDEARDRWGGMSVYIQEEGATLPIEASPYETGQFGPRQNLLQLLHAADRLLVLGEPGSGKTVAMERLAWELCEGPEPTVPVMVRLFHYAGAPLEQWVRSRLQATGHLRLDDDRALRGFLKRDDARCFFLFDGLNEVAPPYRDRLVQDLVRWLADYPRHPVVLTTRPQDELWRRLRRELRQAVMVQAINDEQARDYLVAHLGRANGRALYAQLDQRLQDMARMPLILWLIKEAGAAGESIPGNRGELYTRFVSRMLRRDTERRMDVEIPERVKLQALADLAYHLGRGQRLTCPRDEAVQVAARRLEEGQAETIVVACARHGLLAGEETLWFAPHQTVQEHFAALALRDLAREEWQQGAWKRLALAGRQLLLREPESLAALAADDWWTETFVQLAGLTDDADRLARTVARANPWLGWWCVSEGRDVEEATRVWVEDRSARLLRSKRVADRRRAVQTLSKVRNERTVDPLFLAAADPDGEIAGLAAGALLQMGASLRDRALALARQPEAALHQGGLAYLSALVGQALAWVPPGPFLMGSDKARDPDAFYNELPQHTVPLPGYWIGRYPVTVAQFRAFVEESGRQPEDARSLKGRDDHPVAYVTWHEALAYCRWLAEETGLAVALPSEAEWEKAARGRDGRVYPWGNRRPDDSLCNFGSYRRGTTPVGRYSPDGDSPYGCADMAGNVWEWTRSVFEGYPYDPADGRENLEAGNEVLRVVRGGAFDDAQEDVRCAFRRGYGPSLRDYDIGFRVVVAPVPSEL